MQSNFALEKAVEFYKANPGINNASMFLCLLFPVEDFLVPILLGQVVDSLKEGKKSWVLKLFVLAGTLAAAQVVYFVASMVDAKLLPAMQNYIRNSMFRDMLQGSDGSFSEMPTGELLGRLVKVPKYVTKIVELFKKDVVPYFVGLVAVACVIFMADKVIGVVVVATIAYTFYEFVYAPRRCAAPSATTEAKMARLDEETEDVLRNSMSVFVANQTDSELKRIRVFELDYAAHAWKLLMCTIKHRFYVVVALAVMLGIVGYRCWKGFTDKTLSVGSFVTIFSSLNSMFVTLNWMAGQINTTVYEWGIINAYAKMHDAEAAVPSWGVEEAPKGGPPAKGLMVYDLTYRVPGKREPILQNVSLFVPPGARVAIVGDVGSGKSTLLKMIVRLIVPDSGDIFLDGKSYADSDVREIRARVGYVQQNPTLFNRSIYENITYGLPDVKQEDVRKLLEQTGLQDVFDGLEAGLATKAGKNGSHLSGGQRQVVACIRTILMNPSVVVMDEVTSSLDSEMTKRMIKLFDKMFQGKIVVLATHDPELLKFATATVTLKQGMVVG